MALSRPARLVIGIALLVVSVAMAYQNAYALFEMEGLDGGCDGEAAGGDAADQKDCRPAGMTLAFALVLVWHLVGIAGATLLARNPRVAAA